MNEVELSKVTMRMAIAFGVLFMVNSLCFSILGAFTGGIKWAAMDFDQRFLVCVAICGGWTNVLMAYLSKMVARLHAGKPPIPTNGTEHIKRPDIKP